MENITLNTPVINKQNYAGFWMRFVALIIDSILIWIVQAFIILPILSAMGLVQTFSTPDLNDENSLAVASEMMGTILVASFISIFIGWLYYALMESSSRQATLGKLAVGIIVTDLEGAPISFVQSTARYFSKIISSIILYIGFIMAAFTEKKQGLHDMIAGTLVLSKK